MTGIVFALGEGIVWSLATHTSTYPVEAEGLPDLGYMRALSAEGVLFGCPELILCRGGCGTSRDDLPFSRPPTSPFVHRTRHHRAAGVLAKIRTVGEALGVPDMAETLAREVEAELEAASTPQGPTKPPEADPGMFQNPSRAQAAPEHRTGRPGDRYHNHKVTSLGGFYERVPTDNETTLVAAAARGALSMLHRDDARCPKGPTFLIPPGHYPPPGAVAARGGGGRRALGFSAPGPRSV